MGRRICCTILRSPVDCAAYCSRAVESLKYAIEFGSGSSENGWAQLRKELSTSREEFDTIIKNFAHPVRHGNWMESPAPHAAERLAKLNLT